MTKETLFLALFVVVGIFLSFMRLEKLYGYGFDQERDYYAVKALVVDHKLTLIGPRVISSAGFFLGPFYYYLQAPFFILFRGNPLYGAYFTAAINFSVYLLIYFVLHRLTRSRLLAVASALLWLTAANRTGWNVSFVPIFLLLFLHLNSHLAKKWLYRSLWLLTLITFLSLNFHPQMALLIPIWLYCLSRYHLTSKQIWLLLLAIALPFLPLLLFDFRHQFVNSRAILSFFTSIGKDPTIAPFRPDYSLRQFTTSLTLLHPVFKHNLWLTGLIFALTGLFTLRHRHHFTLWLLPVLSLLVLSFYRERTWPEYYHALGGFSLLLLIIIAANRYLVFRVLLLLLIFFSFWTNISRLRDRTDVTGYFVKKDIILYLLAENQPYEKLNIDNDFRFGDGLGFAPIREYYEKPAGTYHPTLRFYVAEADNPKHNATKKIFGLYAASKVSPPADR